MNIHFGGVRGTTPQADPRFAIYGGHTTSLLVTGQDGEHLILDAGSGIQVVNERLGGKWPARVHVLMTHLHLDHVLGLPLLAPLFDPDCEVVVTAVAHGGASPQRALDSLIVPPLWPLTLADVPAKVSFVEIPTEDLTAERIGLRIGGLKVRGVPVPHPDGCISWRIDEPATGASFVFATDMEWSAAEPEAREAFLELNRCPRPADLLIMDGHFTASELPAHTGWGHSATDQCVEVARAAGVARLLITHHAPENDDRRLDEVEKELQGLWSEAALARQNEIVVLGA